jgi:REP element-mobilizing transposase RayT
MEAERSGRRSIRLVEWDYSQPACYFVTVCCRHGMHLFGRCDSGMVVPSPTGSAVLEEWQRTLEVRALGNDAFCLMPNHFHAIVAVGQAREGWAGHALPLRDDEGTSQAVDARMPCGGNASLPVIIGSFKSAVTKRVNWPGSTAGAAVWQRGYFEHVVRDEESLRRIREYIRTNPLRWHLDRENRERRAADDFDRWIESYRQRP